MLNKKIEAALNNQINHELTAAYSYLAMEAWFEVANWAGFARWMHLQGLEEHEHARKLFKYVLDRGGKIDLMKIERPHADFKTPRDVFAQAAKLEQDNTKAIHQIFAMATDDHDYATQSMLKWFIDEQVEEEKTTKEITALLDIAGDNQSALLLLNKQFGDRAASQG